MNFDFETSRVDCISKQILLLFQYMEKLHLSRRARSTLMHLVNVNKNILFPYIQVDNTLIILPWTVLNS